MERVPTKYVKLTEKTVTTLARMGLAYPAGSEERAAATLLLTKFQNATEEAPALELVDRAAA